MVAIFISKLSTLLLYRKEREKLRSWDSILSFRENTDLKQTERVRDVQVDLRRKDCLAAPSTASDFRMIT